jgi:KUP system potassium uptake protein
LSGSAGSSDTHVLPAHPQPRLIAVTLTALGVVYGDIGTSPLYAMRECFYSSHSVPPTHDNVLGVLSLIIYSLILVVSIKYIVLVMRADNQGEGGILALTALISRPTNTTRLRAGLILLGIIGAALLYGDGMITPAITVLSAVEGLKVSMPVLEEFVVPIAIAILILIFGIQRYGTDRVGGLFGPIMVVWFVSLAAMGIASLVHNPEVLAAVSPFYALQFFRLNGWHGFAVLGGVFLAVTGAERSTPTWATSASGRSGWPGSSSCCRRCS